jgi:hypothetical protein
VKARHLRQDEITAALVPAAWQRAVYRNPALGRLDAYWTGHPLDRTRTSHLARLDFTLAA